ncbi:MAG: C10 family peptidase [Paludibacter sp.]|nr:C10 family peptidase [Paludibacter sp.]
MKTIKYNNFYSQTVLFVIFLFVSLICGSFVINAENKSVENAQRFALEYFKSTNKVNKLQRAAALNISEVQLKYISKDKVPVPVYVFQNDQKGFVVCAQNANGFQVLGYSDNATFDPTDIPESLLQLLKMYENAEPDIIKGIQKANDNTVVVAPLLDEAGVGLNQFRHENVGGSWTGCVATAMAQIMCYYKYPNKGVGSRCFTHSFYGQLCADFENTWYNWVNPGEDDYKLLSYHVGVSMDMNYNQNGSAPLSSRYLYALHDYFGYTCEAFNNFSQYSGLIQYCISQRKPVYAEIPGNPGHAVVLDGFDNNGFFHVNFGWGGGFNGYYQLNNSSFMYVGSKFGTNLFNTLLIQPGRVYLNKTDSLTLVTIKNNISNLNWDLADSQKRSGITTLNGRVIGLNIYSSNNIGNVGSIPEDIGNLTELISLNISGKLHGTIPQSISNLTKLQSLRIANYMGTLSDTIPKDIGNLSNLTNLSIYNAAKGPIPSSIGRLANLQNINLSTGSIDGVIPNEFYNLKNLQGITIVSQKISGNISENLGNLKELIYLNLTSNKVTGKIPSSIGELTKLIYIDLSGNELNGELPLSLKSCNLLSNLKLSNNKFDGLIPSIFDSLSSLMYLDLSKNRLTGISQNIGKLSSIIRLNLNNNQLTSLPDSLNQLRTLQFLDASSNKITWLPENMNQLTSLKTLNLANNEINRFHEDLCYLPNLTEIDLSYNKITSFPALATDLSATILQIQENELSGILPANLLRTQRDLYKFVNNRFVYNDIPVGTDFTNLVGSQKPVKLSKNIFKAYIGDSIEIDIRKLNNNLNKNDKYIWCEYPKIKKGYHTHIEVEQGPVLHLVLSEKNLSKKYFCKITNDSAATFKDPQLNYKLPCLSFLNTDTVFIGLISNEEFLHEKYPDSYIVQSQNIIKKEISDKTIKLISPFKMRGIKKWEGSSDGKTWHELAGSMTQNDLKTNIVSVKTEELTLFPKTPAFYRCKLLETNCAPMYSDTIKVNPYGRVICDTTINVKSKTITIKNDSIEVTIPMGINDGDFRLTIVKLDNPPQKPDSVLRLSSVYDVTVSFGETFYLPIIIKLKNLNKRNFNFKNIEQYKAVYFDDVKQRWALYPDASLNLNDTTVSFGTYHLTKLGFFEINEMNYSHIFTRGRVNVIYKYGTGYDESNYIDLYNQMTKNQGLKSWHETNIDPEKDGNPYMIQDIAEYMNQIINKCENLGLQTPGLRFNVYVKLIGNYGQIGASSYLSGRGYFFVDPMYMCNEKLMIDNRKMLMTTLAHEYTHYTQDYYMTMLIQNYFWQEAVAPIGGRMIWDVVQLPQSEPEILIGEALLSSASNKTIFEILANPWYNDYNLPVVSKLASNSADYNLASLFLHYMQNYRIGSKLDAAVLLKETSYFETWLGYLESYIVKYLKSTTGSEFADYVNYILSGTNPKFTVLNLGDGNPLKYVIRNIVDGGKFASFTNYNFSKHDLKNDNIVLEIPLLSARMYLLNNMTSDKAVVVKYKNKKKNDLGERVYYCNYNVGNMQMIIKEITDSVEYVFLLEARSDKSNTDFLNSGFLLFVNGKNPGFLQSSSFKSSFELSATPVPNITDLCYADVTQNAIHNFSDGSKNLFIISGKVNMATTNYFSFNTENYQTSMDLIEDSIIRTNCTFTQNIRNDNGPNLPASIVNSDKTQIIEYDFITGNLMLHQHTKAIHRWGAYYDDWTKTDKPGFTFKVVETNQKMWLKKVLNFVPDNTKTWEGSTLLFETTNTQETMSTIDKLEESAKTTEYDEKGEVTGSKTVNYLNTEYTSNNKMQLWLHNK